jgi:hypothetical protein
MSDKNPQTPKVQVNLVTPTVSATVVFDSDGTGKSLLPSTAQSISVVSSTTKQGQVIAIVHGQVSGTSVVFNSPA